MLVGVFNTFIWILSVYVDLPESICVLLPLLAILVVVVIVIVVRIVVVISLVVHFSIGVILVVVASNAGVQSPW